MRATKYLVGAAAVAAFACAAPAAAQYYPGYGYPGYGYGGGNVIGQVLNDVLGNGYGNYGANSQVAVNQCAAAVQSRLSGYSGYGYNGYANTGARVLGISRVEPRSNGELVVRGVANSGRYAAYGYNGYSQSAVDLTWKCRVDYRGFVRDIDINRAQPAYGYGNTGTYTPYNNGYDYSQYGYRRY
jgi:hypothetical protein